MAASRGCITYSNSDNLSSSAHRWRAVGAADIVPKPRSPFLSGLPRNRNNNEARISVLMVKEVDATFFFLSPPGLGSSGAVSRDFSSGGTSIFLETTRGFTVRALTSGPSLMFTFIQ